MSSNNREDPKYPKEQTVWSNWTPKWLVVLDFSLCNLITLNLFIFYFFFSIGAHRCSPHVPMGYFNLRQHWCHQVGKLVLCPGLGRSSLVPCWCCNLYVASKTARFQELIQDCRTTILLVFRCFSDIGVHFSIPAFLLSRNFDDIVDIIFLVHS